MASLPAELDPVLDTEGTLEQYRQLDAQVLLMYGSETDPMFVDCAQALQGTSAFHSPTAAGTEPRLSKNIRKAGDDRCGSAADRHAPASGGKQSKELLAEVGTRRAPVSQ